ncbi:Uncharacterised protein [BD1-7 clade bacterium]|uniref:Uncharacterized protein n=1 Tax=BD1-7 clade bacterium TaxID=2029982 RepID=A0A5S9QWT9_9GAMM|nr:Uncharacterised protein [BD1-7 clade bacterium]
MLMRTASINRVIDKPDSKYMYAISLPWYFILDAMHVFFAFGIVVKYPEYFTSAEKALVLIFMIVYFRYRSMLKEATQPHFKLMKVRLFNYLMHRYLTWVVIFSGIGVVVHHKAPYYQDDYILVATLVLCWIYHSMTKAILRVLSVRTVKQNVDHQDKCSSSEVREGYS